MCDNNLERCITRFNGLFLQVDYNIGKLIIKVVMYMKIISVVLFAFILSACGGSGGDSNNSQSEKPPQEPTEKYGNINDTDKLLIGNWVVGNDLIEWMASSGDLMVLLDESDSRVFSFVESSSDIPMALADVNMHTETPQSDLIRVVSENDNLERRWATNQFTAGFGLLYTNHSAKYWGVNSYDNWDVNISVYHTKDGLDAKEIKISVQEYGRVTFSCEYRGWDDYEDSTCEYYGNVYVIGHDILDEINYIFNINEQTINHDWAIRIKNSFMDYLNLK